MEPYNPQIIAIVIQHFFCNVESFSEEEYLSYYFKFMSIVSKDAYVYWADNSLDDYIIWKPFEHMEPSVIVVLMQNLYTGILEGLNLSSEYITTNRLELASELATDSLESKVTQPYLKELNGDTRHTEEAQGIFNEAFNHYIEILDNNNLNKIK